MPASAQRSRVEPGRSSFWRSSLSSSLPCWRTNSKVRASTSARGPACGERRRSPAQVPRRRQAGPALLDSGPEPRTMLKKLFGKGSPVPATQELTIEDLVVLERYEEAIERLEKKTHDNPQRPAFAPAPGGGLRPGRQGRQGARRVPLRRRHVHRRRLLRQGARAAHQGRPPRARRTTRCAPGCSASSDSRTLEHSRVLAIEGLVAGAERAGSAGAHLAGRGRAHLAGAREHLGRRASLGRPAEAPVRRLRAAGLARRARDRRARQPRRVPAHPDHRRRRGAVHAPATASAFSCAPSRRATSSANGRCSSTSPGRRTTA